jgi:hypothetical protein
MPDTFRFLTFAQEPPVKRSQTRCTCGMSSSPGDAIYSFQEQLAGFSLTTCGLQERRDAWQDQAWPLWGTAVGQGSRRKYSNSNVHILFMLGGCWEGRGERKACTIQRFISWYSDGAFHSYNLSRWVYLCVVKL